MHIFMKNCRKCSGKGYTENYIYKGDSKNDPVKGPPISCSCNNGFSYSEKTSHIVEGATAESITKTYWILTYKKGSLGIEVTQKHKDWEDLQFEINNLMWADSKTEITVHRFDVNTSVTPLTVSYHLPKPAAVKTTF